jgi:GT2 family glycosyltransferase
MDVSIIIVNWNTEALLRDCLSSIYEQTTNINYEIIVVDNASTDQSIEMVRHNFPTVKLIQNKENRGFAAANNQAIETAQGRYILLLNSDTIVLDKAIEKTFAFANTHPEAGATGCRVLNPDGTIQTTCFTFPSLLNMFLSFTYLYKFFPKNRFFGREQMTWWDRNDVRQVDVITGCFMLIRREAIEQVGLMDESFFVYAEETDFCYRLKKNGWKVMFTPVGQIIHFGGQSTAKIPVSMIIHLRLNILRFIKKHYRWPSHIIARCLVAMFFAVRLPVWGTMFILRPRLRNEATIKIRAYSRGIADVLFSRIDIQKADKTFCCLKPQKIQDTIV